MLLVQCRGETNFHDNGEGVGSRYQELCDLLRETAAMLLFAQERVRDGVTEVKPGDGKWWATRPRWGGAPNRGSGGDDDDNRNRKDDVNDNDGSDARTAAKRSKFDRHSLPLKRSMANQARKLTMAEKWNIVQPGPSLWDRKMRYMQIGKDKNSPFDDVRTQTSRFLSRFSHCSLYDFAQYTYISCLGSVVLTIARSSCSRRSTIMFRFCISVYIIDTSSGLSRVTPTFPISPKARCNLRGMLLSFAGLDGLISYK
jgi:hypothetical protein